VYDFHFSNSFYNHPRRNRHFQSRICFHYKKQHVTPQQFITLDELLLFYVSNLFAQTARQISVGGFALRRR
jgi:hypothetical protein